MAKKQNIEDLGAGLTFGDSQKAVSRGEEKREQPVQKQNVPPVSQPAPAVEPVKTQDKDTEVKGAAASSESLAAIYAGKMQVEQEARSVRIQAVVTQTTAERLDKLARDRKIKSRNDLINFLLEGYLDSVE